MKKAISILCMFILLFTVACGKQNVDEMPSTKGDIQHNVTTKQVATTDDELVDEQNTLKVEESSKEIISTFYNTSKNNAEEVPPYILTVDLNDLKKIKTAVETMDESEFAKYMSENFANEVMNGMDTAEKARNILNQLENSYIAFVDKPYDDNIISFYIESHKFFGDVALNENCRLRYTVYTNNTEDYGYKEADIVKLIKTYDVDDITVELYKNIADETEGFYGNIRFNNQVIPFFLTKNITIEEFEEFVPRIGVVKVGDLINE